MTGHHTADFCSRCVKCLLLLHYAYSLGILFPAALGWLLALSGHPLGPPLIDVAAVVGVASLYGVGRVFLASRTAWATGGAAAAAVTAVLIFLPFDVFWRGWTVAELAALLVGFVGTTILAYVTHSIVLGTAGFFISFVGFISVMGYYAGEFGSNTMRVYAWVGLVYATLVLLASLVSVEEITGRYAMAGSRQASRWTQAEFALLTPTS